MCLTCFCECLTCFCECLTCLCVFDLSLCVWSCVCVLDLFLWVCLTCLCVFDPVFVSVFNLSLWVCLTCLCVFDLSLCVWPVFVCLTCLCGGWYFFVVVDLSLWWLTVFVVTVDRAAELCQRTWTGLVGYADTGPEHRFPTPSSKIGCRKLVLGGRPCLCCAAVSRNSSTTSSVLVEKSCRVAHTSLRNMIIMVCWCGDQIYLAG